MSSVTGPDSAPNRAGELERLVDRYQTSILRMCWFCLYDKTQAEDAVQETFLKVWRGLDSFRGEADEKTWIMKIAMHTCYDMNRSGWFRVFNRRLTPEMLPEAAAPFREEDDELTCAVARLPMKLREVILLYYYQGMKVNDIASALGISQSSVSGRLKRGREKLRDILEGRETDAERT